MKRTFYSILIMFLFIGGLFFFISPKAYAVDFCPEVKGKFNPGDVVCIGDGTGNRQICQDVSGAWVPYEPSCGHIEGEPNNGDRCNDANPTVCLATPTPTPQPTAAAGDKDCIVTTIGPDNINPPVTMKSGTAKCINNVATTCTNGNKTFLNCTGQSNGCAEINASTATCSGPTPTQAPAGPNPTSTPAPGYWIPQPGYNCGRVKEDPQADDVSVGCCNSAIASWGDLPADTVNIGPFDNFPLIDKIKAFVLQGLSSSFNNFPIPVDPFNISDKLPFSVKNVKKAFNSVPVCLPGGKPSADRKDPSCKCILDPTQPNPALTNLSSLCDRISNNTEKASCKSCVGGVGNVFGGGIWTGLGCINVSENGFINSAVNIGIGLGGGFALMCIIYAAFLLQTSGGSPEAIKKARDLMTSCITGLILIIFSVFILKVIGYDILKLPGFGN